VPAVWIRIAVTTNERQQPPSLHAEVFDLIPIAVCLAAEEQTPPVLDHHAALVERHGVQVVDDGRYRYGDQDDYFHQLEDRNRCRVPWILSAEEARQTVDESSNQKANQNQPN